MTIREGNPIVIDTFFRIFTPLLYKINLDAIRNNAALESFIE